ncbi:TerB family tellurite resistance protein [Flavobacterium sp. LB1P62]|uniref:tellurite resistance TerB family protein n=1 Tax=unclassified Flavobacterium TaxID=196869 RepID=UPI003AAA3B0D
MSFSDLFDSEFKQRNKGHFSAIVRVALADEKFVPEEKLFLDKLAVRLEISPEEYTEILENPLKYPINAPYLHEQRLERLYDLARMVHVDHHLGDKQELLLGKIGVALGFNGENVNYIISKALSLVDKKVDLDTFLFEMQNMHK